MSDMTRLQVDILKRQLEELEKLQELGGLRSKRELWDTAFTFLKWAARKKAQGSAVGSLNAEGIFTELEMPFLEEYAAHARKEQSEMANTNNSNIPTKAAETEVASVSHNGSGKNIHLTKRKRTA